MTYIKPLIDWPDLSTVSSYFRRNSLSCRSHHYSIHLCRQVKEMGSACNWHWLVRYGKFHHLRKNVWYNFLLTESFPCCLRNLFDRGQRLDCVIFFLMDPCLWIRWYFEETLMCRQTNEEIQLLDGLIWIRNDIHSRGLRFLSRRNYYTSYFLSWPSSPSLLLLLLLLFLLLLWIKPRYRRRFWIPERIICHFQPKYWSIWAYWWRCRYLRRRVRAM